MRLASSAICTSGEPVSVSCVRCSPMVSCLDMGPRFRVGGLAAAPGGAAASRRSRELRRTPARLRAPHRRHRYARPVVVGARIERRRRSTKTFDDARSVAASQALGRAIDLDVAGRRGRHRARAERQRQDDAAAPGRRPRRADHRHGHRRRDDPARRPGGQAGRLRAAVPGLLPWRTVAANARLLLDVNRRGRRPPAPDPARPARRGRARRLRRRLPARAVGWHAAARRPRAGDGARRPAAADGRAVRRPRRDHPRRHAPPAGPPVRAAGDDGAVRHPLDRRGRVPLRSRRRAVGPARAASSASSRSTCPAPASPTSRTTRRSSPTRPACGRSSTRDRGTSERSERLADASLTAGRVEPGCGCVAADRARRAHRHRRVRRVVGAVRPGLRRAPVRAAAAVARSSRSSPTGRASTWRRPPSPPATPPPASPSPSSSPC